MFIILFTFVDLIGSPNPLTHVYAWQFRLTHEFNLREHGNELSDCVNEAKQNYENQEVFNNILKFLLYLRKVPSKDKNKLVRLFKYFIIILTK